MKVEIKRILLLSLLFSCLFSVNISLGYGQTQVCYWADGDDISLHYVGESESYYYAHNNVTANANSAGWTTFYVGQAESPTSDVNYQIFRGILFFDTSGIPDDANITRAYISLHCSLKRITTEANNFWVIIQNASTTVPHKPTVDGDYWYQYYEDTNLGQKWSCDWENDTREEVYLNNIGLSWINKFGFSNFTLRSSHDIYPVPAYDYEYMIFFASEKAGTDYDPQLCIWYELDPWIKCYQINFFLFICGIGCVCGPPMAVAHMTRAKRGLKAMALLYAIIIFFIGIALLTALPLC